MLLPSDIGYYDLDCIAAMSGKGWTPFAANVMQEDLLDSYEIMIKAIEKARNSTNC